MTILFNTDRNLTVHDDFKNKLSSHLSEKLTRFSEHITRLEVHLSDENGHRTGPHDKKCLLEAKVEGRPAVAVSADAQNYELAVDAAVEKLRSSLASIFGRMQNH